MLRVKFSTVDSVGRDIPHSELIWDGKTFHGNTRVTREPIWVGDDDVSADQEPERFMRNLWRHYKSAYFRAGQAVVQHDFAEKDIALGGKDGKRAQHLLSRAISEGAAKLRELTRVAVKRLLAKGPAAFLRARRLFDDDERKALSNQIVDTNGISELLGRVRIRERHAKVKDSGGSLKKFSEEETTFHVFDQAGPLEPMVPKRALEYFRGLVPEIGVDTSTWGTGLARRAFAMAVAADETVIEKVQDYIANALETGEVSTGPEDIDAILDAAGVGQRQAGYSETVFRTNMMDAYNTGAEAEGLEVKETFPVWKMSNPDDGRSRPTHAARNGKYYPNEAGSQFSDVRGDDIGEMANCRCVPIFVDKFEWADLEAAGVSVETDW